MEYPSAGDWTHEFWHAQATKQSSIEKEAAAFYGPVKKVLKDMLGVKRKDEKKHVG